MKNNRSINIRLTILIIGALCSFYELCMDAYSKDSLLTNLYIYQSFFLFIVSFYDSYKKLGILHIFSLLHITTFVFAFGGLLVFLLLGMDGFKTAYTPLYVKFNEETVQQALCLYCLFICISSISFFYFYNRKWFKKHNHAVLKKDDSMFELGKYTMLLMLPFALLSSYTQYKIGFENRGALYASGSMSELGMPLYLRITNMLFVTGFYAMIASVPTKKEFIRYFSIYLVTLIPILMMGERGEVVAPIIFLLWYLYREYNYQINKALLFGSGISVMVLSFAVSVIRLGDTLKGISFSDMITGFFGTSATSLELLQYYIEFKKDVIPHTYPFVIDSMIGGLTGAYGQSLETLEIRSSLGHQLVYTLNPNYYLSGFSSGTSFIAECYEFGIAGIIIGGVVLGYVCNVFNAYITKSHLLMLYLYLSFQMIILSPRGSLFISIYDIIKYSLCYIILKQTLGKFVNRKKYNKK